MIFTVLIDQQEKHAYRFGGLHADSALQYRPLAIRTRIAHLKTGDYSIAGADRLLSIERKSLDDLFGTLSSEKRRDRFEREHERLAALNFAAVVIEASWDRILQGHHRCALNPKTIFRTHCSWLVRYGVPWITCENRRLAEITTFRLLEKWWLESQDRLLERSDTCHICGRLLRDHDSVRRGLGPVCRAKGSYEAALRIQRVNAELKRGAGE